MLGDVQCSLASNGGTVCGELEKVHSSNSAEVCTYGTPPPFVASKTENYLHKYHSRPGAEGIRTVVNLGSNSDLNKWHHVLEAIKPNPGMRGGKSEAKRAAYTRKKTAGNNIEIEKDKT